MGGSSTSCWITGSSSTPSTPRAWIGRAIASASAASKSDPFDAQVLALFLRSDHVQLRPLRPSSEAAQELKGLTRDYRRQVHLQTRLLNQLTATVKEYYPRALELCEDLTAHWAQAFLAHYPTPAAAAALTRGRLAEPSRAPTGSAPTRTAALWEILQQPQLPLPAHVVRIKARLLQALLRELAPTLAVVAEYRQAIDDFFATLPTAEIARSLPVGKSGTTVPTIWAELGDHLDRWDSFRHAAGLRRQRPGDRAQRQTSSWSSSASPVTRALRDALHQLAFLSLPHSLWARAYYDRYRARNHTHHEALRALGAKWLKIIFVMWKRHVPYSETHHLATMARQQLQQPAA